MRGALGGVVSALVASAAVPAAERDRIATAVTIAVRRRRRPANWPSPVRDTLLCFRVPVAEATKHDWLLRTVTAGSSPRWAEATQARSVQHLTREAASGAQLGRQPLERPGPGADNPG